MTGDDHSNFSNLHNILDNMDNQLQILGNDINNLSTTTIIPTTTTITTTASTNPSFVGYSTIPNPLIQPDDDKTFIFVPDLNKIKDNLSDYQFERVDENQLLIFKLKVSNRKKKNGNASIDTKMFGYPQHFYAPSTKENMLHIL